MRAARHRARPAPVHVCMTGNLTASRLAFCTNCVANRNLGQDPQSPPVILIVTGAEPRGGQAFALPKFQRDGTLGVFGSEKTAWKEFSAAENSLKMGCMLLARIKIQ